MLRLLRAWPRISWVEINEYETLGTGVVWTELDSRNSNAGHVLVAESIWTIWKAEYVMEIHGSQSQLDFFSFFGHISCAHEATTSQGLVHGFKLNPLGWSPNDFWFFRAGNHQLWCRAKDLGLESLFYNLPMHLAALLGCFLHWIVVCVIRLLVDIRTTFNLKHSWLVVWNMTFMTFHSVGKFILPRRTPSFFRRVSSNHQPDRVLFGSYFSNSFECVRTQLHQWIPVEVDSAS